MFKKYVKQFLTDESGMELLQLAIVVVITVGLIGVMTKLMNTVRENISKANDNANKMCIRDSFYCYRIILLFHYVIFAFFYCESSLLGKSRQCR